MIQNFGDWYFANESSSLNTPSIWLVKWFSWVQNNEKQVCKPQETRANQFSWSKTTRVGLLR
ncbi:hypothetical protein M1S31_11850 [Acinetobacter baumannii]|nr:hypothetical protein [Acinetobacter baumannii]UQM58270.1 hypothetical protein M1S31_11850 [Acinetobacter baumannii]